MGSNPNSFLRKKCFSFCFVHVVLLILLIFWSESRANAIKKAKGSL